jgi:Zn-dependent M28 family amino/carboxypeptidase
MTKRRIFPVLLLSAGLLFGAQNPVPESLRDLAQLKQVSNPARLEALQKMLRERGIPYELQPFESQASPHGRTKGTNLIVTFGKGPREITLGAHYDALELPGGGMVDGMIDNGAAAIILVRVAEGLKGRDLHHRVRVVFFDMEETGMVGSQAYVAAHKPEIDAAIIMDIAGLGRDALIYGSGKATGTDLVKKSFLMSCAQQLLTCIDSENYPASDDRSFQNANIPVVSFAMGPRLSLYQFWLMLNGGEKSGLEKGFMPSVFTVIHSPEDNISKIDPVALDLEYKLLLDTVLRLDAAPK